MRFSEIAGETGIFVDGDWIEKKDQDAKGAVRLIQLADVGPGEFRDKSDRHITVEKADELHCTFLRKGDVLIARLGDPLCKACVFPLDGLYITAVDVAILRIGSDVVNPKYLIYLLNSPWFKDQVKQYESGTTRKRISRKNLDRIEMIFPPLSEQERIVARIEELFSQLDAGVETLKKTKAEIVLYRQAVFSSVIGKYDGVSKKLSDIAVTVDGDRGKNYPKKAELTQTGDCLFLTAANVKPYGWSFEDNTFISKEKDSILHGGRLQKNDVVITTRGTLGNVAIYDESVPFDTVRINSCMLIIRVTDESVSPYYLAQYLMSPMFKYQIAKLKSGTAQPQIPANILREIPLKIPSSNDQNAIIGELTGKFSVCDSIEQTVDTALQQAEAMRQSILKDAFEGKL